MRTIAALHPEAKRVIEIMAELDKGIVPPVPVSEMRAFARRRSARLSAPPPPVGRIENITIANGSHPVPVRLYHPAGATGPLPAYIYAHGGGFVVGDLDMVETACRTICRDAGIIVASVDYRLAPEHKFPAGLEDTIAVVREIVGNRARYGIDANRLAIGGDSAGGNLAAAVAQAVKGETGVSLKYQVLVYPVTDLTCSEASYKDLGTGYPLTADRMHAYIKHYLANPAEAKDVRASPLLAKSLAGLPEALVIVAGLDPLVDEGLAYARRLKEAGVAVEVAEVPDHPHGFLGWTGECEAARRMLALITKRVGERLKA